MWQTGLLQIASRSLDRFLYLPFRDRVILWIARLRTVMNDAGMFAGSVNLCGTIRVDVRDLGGPAEAFHMSIVLALILYRTGMTPETL